MIKRRSMTQFEVGFCKALFYHLIGISASTAKTTLKLLLARGENEYGYRSVAESLLHVDSTFNVDIHNQVETVISDAFHLTLQSAVASAGIYFLPLNKLACIYATTEFFGTNKIILHPVALIATRFSGSGRHRETKFQFRTLHKSLYNGRLAGTARR